jgi:hypothetical protein
MCGWGVYCVVGVYIVWLGAGVLPLRSNVPRSACTLSLCDFGHLRFL